MSDTITSSCFDIGSGFEVGDILWVQQGSGKESTMKITSISNPGLITVRKFYWFDKSWGRIKWECLTTFPFLAKEPRKYLALSIEEWLEEKRLP